MEHTGIQAISFKNDSILRSGIFKEINALTNERRNAEKQNNFVAVAEFEARFWQVWQQVKDKGNWSVKIYIKTTNGYPYHITCFKKTSAFGFLNKLTDSEFEGKKWLAELPSGNYVARWFSGGAVHKMATTPFLYLWVISLLPDGRRQAIEFHNVKRTKGTHDWHEATRWIID